MANIFNKYGLYFALFLLVFIAFWPITSGLYLPKWDNIDCYLPYRYFVHFSYENGQLPLWNPFQHLGYPAYSDLQNGLYNPIVWFIHLFGNYDTLSVAIELSIYWMIGAFGAFKFMRLFTAHPYSQFFGAIAFGLSGFMVGTAQIMIFIAGAAFLPHVLYHLIRFFQSNMWKDSLWLSLFLGLHISAASPAYTIVLFYIILLMFIWALWKKYTSSNPLNWTWSKLLFTAILTLLCILPIISSTFEFLPYFGRANKLEYGSFLLQNPFDWHEYISFLFPLSTLSSSEWFGSTDLTMRNAYIGFIPFLFAAWTLVRVREVKIGLLWAIFGLFLLLAAGGETPIYKLFYQLPGFGLFRHPSIFRAHAILALTTLAAIGFDHFISNNDERTKQLRTISLVSASIFLLLLLVLIWLRFPGEITSWLTEFSFDKNPIPLSLRTGLLLNTFLLLLTSCLLFVGIVVKKKQLNQLIILLTSMDLLLHALISGPYTISYPYKQADYQEYFKQLPKRIDQGDVQKEYASLIENYEPKIPGIWRNTATLHKRLTFDGHNQTQFQAFNELEKSGRFERLLVNPLFSEVAAFRMEAGDNKLEAKSTIPKAMLWQWDGPTNAFNPDTMLVSDSKIGFNSFEVNIKNHSNRPDILLLTQNYHHNWSAKLNDQNARIYKANEAIMGIVIPAQSSGKVTLVFKSPGFLPSTITAFVAYVFLAICLFFNYLNKKRAS